MTPDQHYEEAERLLDRAAKLTEDWVEKTQGTEVTTTATNVKLLNLEILARMLTSRANVHAKLATAKYAPRPMPVEVPTNGRGSDYFTYHQEIHDRDPAL